MELVQLGAVDCSRNLLSGQRIISQLTGQHAEQIVGIDVAGIGLKNVPRNLLGGL